MEKNQQNDVAYINKQATLLFTVVTVCLFIAYLVQFLQGSKTMMVFGLLAVTDLVPMIACWVMLKANPDSGLIRHVMGIGYGIFFTISCFSSSEQMVFTYAIPMIIVISFFNDFRFSITVNAGVVIISAIHSIWFAKGLEFSHEAVAAMEIELVVMLLACLFSVVISRGTEVLNGRKIGKINEQNEKTNQMLEDVKDVANSVVSVVGRITDKMTTLSASSEETLTSMQEIQSGTTDSAESIQNQLLKTEEIQKQIENVKSASETIGSNVEETNVAIKEGTGNINKLMTQAKESERAGNAVMKEVEELKASADEMQTIVSLIRSVASQTSLLALNASIEAARAGDAGRGFAVVATEISNLANQTTTATGNISDLIENISKEMNEVIDSIGQLIESNNIQNESANVTAGSFEKIVSSAESIKVNSNELAQIVKKLVTANDEIVESIQNISAITEEVSAHSTTTCDATEHNQKIVEDVIYIVEEMNRSVEKLRSM